MITSYNTKTLRCATPGCAGRLVLVTNRDTIIRDQAKLEGWTYWKSVYGVEDDRCPVCSNKVPSENHRDDELVELRAENYVLVELLAEERRALSEEERQRRKAASKQSLLSTLIGAVRHRRPK